MSLPESDAKLVLFLYAAIGLRVFFIFFTLFIKTVELLHLVCGIEIIFDKRT